MTHSLGMCSLIQTLLITRCWYKGSLSLNLYPVHVPSLYLSKDLNHAPLLWRKSLNLARCMYNAKYCIQIEISPKFLWWQFCASSNFLSLLPWQLFVQSFSPTFTSSALNLVVRVPWDIDSYGSCSIIAVAFQQELPQKQIWVGELRQELTKVSSNNWKCTLHHQWLDYSRQSRRLIALRFGLPNFSINFVCSVVTWPPGRTS